ncbi:hypothetical protein [Oleidesulfovibrio alaskensis]|jgi:hypothetical protein|uniref:hypothetical protein n=1 Tax=Oleidesulfovibrio alaskensis TaxID=58180 RepID=UPI001A511EC4|nr:hypothetical protein [Oleidesulfovibrio alaskensis]MBL3581851.1 hypothetical protein [Oleidesulfovibrio alaskensis]
MSVIQDNLHAMEQVLRHLRSAEHDSAEARLCKWALAEICEQSGAYAATVLAKTPFAAQFGSVLAEAAESGNCFALLETLTLFCRERVLRRPDMPESSMEAALFSYFVHSGEWTFADGTLVTDWFYVRLPVMVLFDLCTTAMHGSGGGVSAAVHG